MTQTPEQLARRQIDAQLSACGWVVQDYQALDFTAGRGIAVRDRQPATGGSFAAINLAESVYGRTSLKLEFLIHPAAFNLGVSRLRQSILQNAFTGELT